MEFGDSDIFNHKYVLFFSRDGSESFACGCLFRGYSYCFQLDNLLKGTVKALRWAIKSSPWSIIGKEKSENETADDHPSPIFIRVLLLSLSESVLLPISSFIYDTFGMIKRWLFIFALNYAKPTNLISCETVVR